MPAKFLPIALRLALLPVLASAQVTFHETGSISNSQSVLPSEGPAAARFNPAALADVHLASLTYGFALSTRGEYLPISLQLAAGMPWDWLHWPVAVAVGLGYYSNDDYFDESNEILEESEWDPSLAIAFPANPQAPLRIAAGIASTQITYNSFGAMRTNAVGTDAGLMGTATGERGRFGVGWAYHHMQSPHIRLPDEGSYTIPGWQEWSANWNSPARKVSLHMSLYYNDSPDPAEGPSHEPRLGMNGWDAEVRPLPWFAIKLERTRLVPLSSLGLVLYPSVAKAPVDVRFELNVGHSSYDPAVLLLGSKPLDEDLGWILGASLSVGI